MSHAEFLSPSRLATLQTISIQSKPVFVSYLVDRPKCVLFHVPSLQKAIGRKNIRGNISNSLTRAMRASVFRSTPKLPKSCSSSPPETDSSTTSSGGGGGSSSSGEETLSDRRKRLTKGCVTWLTVRGAIKILQRTRIAPSIQAEALEAIRTYLQARLGSSRCDVHADLDTLSKTFFVDLPSGIDAGATADQSSLEDAAPAAKKQKTEEGSVPPDRPEVIVHSQIIDNDRTISSTDRFMACLYDIGTGVACVALFDRRPLLSAADANPALSVPTPTEKEAATTTTLPTLSDQLKLQSPVSAIQIGQWRIVPVIWPEHVCTRRFANLSEVSNFFFDPLPGAQDETVSHMNRAKLFAVCMSVPLKNWIVLYNTLKSAPSH